MYPIMYPDCDPNEEENFRVNVINDLVGNERHCRATPTSLCDGYLPTKEQPELVDRSSVSDELT